MKLVRPHKFTSYFIIYIYIYIERERERERDKYNKYLILEYIVSYIWIQSNEYQLINIIII